MVKGYKNTPIGRIPADWEVVRFGDVAQIIMGQAPPSSTYNKEGNGLPFLQGKAEFKEIYPSPSIYCSKPIKIAETNDILLSVRAPVGDVNITPFRCCIGRGLAAVRAKKGKLYYLFLFYYLKLNGKKFENLSSGSTFKAIKKEDIENFFISLPSLPEQKKIAEILSTVDKAIQKVDEAIVKAERLKKGLMQELLTKGIGHKEFKDTEIGRIPKEWEVVRLGKVLEICQYGLSVPLKEKGKYPIIRMDEIVNGYVIPHITKYTDIDEETFRKFRLEKGDVLFNRTNSYELVGRTGIFLLDGDYVFASYLIRLRPKHDVLHSHFLTFYLIFSQDKLRQLATKAVHQANINATNLKNFKIPLPPLPEQQKIAEILSAVDKKLELERKRKEKLERIKKGLMNDLLTGRRRVKT